MNPVLSSLCIAFSTYSVLPAPRAAWEKGNMRWVMCFFPLVGVVIGAVMFGWLWLSARLGLMSGLSAAVAAAIPVLLTGGIHLDGFCDTADALASHAPAEKKLEILKDSHVGAFALIGCVLYLLLTFGFWTQYLFRPESAAALALGFVFSRSLSGISVVAFRCAKNSGLAAMFSDASAKSNAYVGLLVWVGAVALLMLSCSLFIGALCLTGALMMFLYYKWTAYRQFGGITGDLAGWFLQLCELAMLAAAVIGGLFQ